MIKETKLSVQSGVDEKLKECEHWHKAHSFALQVVRDSKLQRMCAEVSKPIDLGMSCFVSVLDFLMGAGQQQLATQVCMFGEVMHVSLYRGKILIQDAILIAKKLRRKKFYTMYLISNVKVKKVTKILIMFKMS